MPVKERQRHLQKPLETKEEAGDDDDGNDFEKVMKANYYDTAVD
jgi:hypothetical protein